MFNSQIFEGRRIKRPKLSFVFHTKFGLFDSTPSISKSINDSFLKKCAFLSRKLFKVGKIFLLKTSKTLFVRKIFFFKTPQQPRHWNRSQTYKFPRTTVTKPFQGRSAASDCLNSIQWNRLTQFDIKRKRVHLWKTSTCAFTATFVSDKHMTGNDFEENVFFTIWMKFYDFDDLCRKIIHLSVMWLERRLKLK